MCFRKLIRLAPLLLRITFLIISAAASAWRPHCIIFFHTKMKKRTNLGASCVYFFLSSCHSINPLACFSVHDFLFFVLNNYFFFCHFFRDSIRGECINELSFPNRPTTHHARIVTQTNPEQATKAKQKQNKQYTTHVNPFASFFPCLLLFSVGFGVLFCAHVNPVHYTTSFFFFIILVPSIHPLG